MRSKDSCPVWGEGAGKVPNWQLADALLYRMLGSVRAALGNQRRYSTTETAFHGDDGSRQRTASDPKQTLLSVINHNWLRRPRD